jgi:hypothetical protein
MVLTAYFDESGTHAGSELSVMAGFLGNARQWRKLEKRSAKLFDRYKVDVFHTIDVRRSDKDFEGWKVDRKIEFLDVLVIGYCGPRRIPVTFINERTVTCPRVAATSPLIMVCVKTTS